MEPNIPIVRPGARHLADKGIQYRVLHNQQFGALPKKLATNPVSSLVHNIKKAWADVRIALLLTLDVEGAFDKVYSARLQICLREQG